MPAALYDTVYVWCRQRNVVYFIVYRRLDALLLLPCQRAQPTQCCCDAELDPYYILHYTYGDDYTLEGAFTPGKVS